MKMIEFKRSGSRAAINPAHVVRIRENGNETKISLVADVPIIVDEAFDDVLAKLRGLH